MPIRQIASVAILLQLFATYIQAEEAPPPRPWAEAMAKFEAADTETPPSSGGVVFVGSSSIRLWDLPRWFGDLEGPILNRGFGGSQIEDSVREIDLLVLRHQPRAVVLYAGDNDLAGGKSAAQVERDFVQFTQKVHAALPETPIHFIAIKPSTSRWFLKETIEDANGRIQSCCADKRLLTYVDIWTPMLDDDGQPRSDLLAEDGLHLSDAGYAIWSRLVLQALESSD